MLQNSQRDIVDLRRKIISGDERPVVAIGGFMTNSLRFHRLTRLALLAALAALLIPLQLTAAAGATHHHYKLIDLGTFGGPGSYLNTSDNAEWPIINNAGTVVGGADTSVQTPVPGCYQPVGKS